MGGGQGEDDPGFDQNQIQLGPSGLIGFNSQTGGSHIDNQNFNRAQQVYKGSFKSSWLSTKRPDFDRGNAYYSDSIGGAGQNAKYDYKRAYFNNNKNQNINGSNQSQSGPGPGSNQQQKSNLNSNMGSPQSQSRFNNRMSNSGAGPGHQQRPESIDPFALSGLSPDQRSRSPSQQQNRSNFGSLHNLQEDSTTTMSKNSKSFLGQQDNRSGLFQGTVQSDQNQDQILDNDQRGLDISIKSLEGDHNMVSPSEAKIFLGTKKNDARLKTQKNLHIHGYSEQVQRYQSPQGQGPGLRGPGPRQQNVESDDDENNKPIYLQDVVQEEKHQRTVAYGNASSSSGNIVTNVDNDDTNNYGKYSQENLLKNPLHRERQGEIPIGQRLKENYNNINLRMGNNTNSINDKKFSNSESDPSHYLPIYEEPLTHPPPFSGYQVSDGVQPYDLNHLQYTRNSKTVQTTAASQKSLYACKSQKSLAQLGRCMRKIFKIYGSKNPISDNSGNSNVMKNDHAANSVLPELLNTASLREVIRRAGIGVDVLPEAELINLVQKVTNCNRNGSYSNSSSVHRVLNFEEFADFVLELGLYIYGDGPGHLNEGEVTRKLFEDYLFGLVEG